MLMERGSTAMPPANPGKPLERIGLAADRLAATTDHLHGLWNNFYGAASADISENIQRCGYEGDLDRLFANIDKLDKLVSGIREIG